MKSRGRIASPRLRTTPDLACNLQDQITKSKRAKWGSTVNLCTAQISRCACRLGVNSLHYRIAAFLSASPQLAESIRAAKRFRVVPILLQKSFSTVIKFFSRPLVRFSDKYVSDLVSQ
jgi:hypothetical protein